MNWQELSEQQQTVAKVLRHAIKRNELAHAYLLEGLKGTGKRQTALLVAQTLFCESLSDQGPCMECRNCRRIASGNHPDVIWITPDEGAASIKKEQIAYLMKEFAFRSVESGRKVFIIEQAEKMTTQAENSLLKFIEEPHPGTLALLVTEHIHQLLDTIISRCQVLSFIPLSDRAVERRLAQDGQPKQLVKLAAALTHDYEEGLLLCKEEWFAEARSQVLQLVQRLHKSSESVLPYIYEKFSPNFDNNQKMAVGLDLLLFWYRDLLSLHLNRQEEIVFEDQVDGLKEQMLSLSSDQTIRAMSFILDGRRQLDAHVNGVSVMERLVIRLGGNHK
ncbi:DNA polymerase III subunit delta' [Sporolactobacillus laevolacticus]|uniref:DNA polymerase III subunit delta' n=1 Tax=Sporolactobacillus laevolacticus DSM 442 TaxID=1395513 RepID=V6J0P7_9BACL|nr:DNA polymerase III subunit delta' [Sporolactobacillus laevolacticus]EST10334.1 DNA polymerase III subunit delta' [Sporolactobacillus laevolacticus DSM 442]